MQCEVPKSLALAIAEDDLMVGTVMVGVRAARALPPHQCPCIIRSTQVCMPSAARLPYVVRRGLVWGTYCACAPMRAALVAPHRVSRERLRAGMEDKRHGYRCHETLFAITINQGRQVLQAPPCLTFKPFSLRLRHVNCK